jgi:predicted alpha/beta superfamily hydrolase
VIDEPQQRCDEFFVSIRTKMKITRQTALISMLSIAALFVTACTHKSIDEPAVATLEPQTSSSMDGAPLVMGHTYTIKSDVLRMDRRISVKLPNGYVEQEGVKFPVVYVIDGGPEQDFPHLAGIVQSRDINGTFGQFILVGIETVNRSHQIVPPASDVETYEAELGQKPGGSAKFRDFIRDEVQPWVKQKYRSNGRDVVIGESLGGLFIVESLFEEPTLFDDYIAVTPSLWWEDMKYGKEAKAYLSKLPTGPRRLYITASDEGFRHQEGTDMLVETLKTNAPDDLKWIYFARGDRETHASIYHGAALDAFRILFPRTSQYGRAGSLLSGEPLPPRTPEHEARIAQECTVETAIQLTPGENLAADPLENAYRCMVFDYGDKATAGNMTKFTGAGPIEE